ncbi:glucosamine-6-phosphate deaminase [uncultured Rubinisphaera sp.]|uniref:glucosamine-6-phosphate deaminase n=1 Tax=uncultured Rubinisphaera sp. TaxID=1678686 RepID=UPI000EEFBC58|nr:glucosamine-6-phosphate deaminase [Planctomycetaceae bacterium]|tara:strand:+ start:6335 stop:7069 length:735 start_codon:yes stop_codon:yes gene_type:complete
MKIEIFATEQEMGQAAAEAGAEKIRQALAERGEARIIVATGASQFTVLGALVKQPDIDWSKVTGFHLDEYLGLPMSHPASFRGYLKERFVDQVSLKAFHYLDGETDPQEECERVGKLLTEAPIDVAFVGIGENGHLAFNDPPADFDTEQPYLVVDLDEACRRQQHGEGWFPTMDDVPTQALSMSVKQILKTSTIICSVPDERKAEAVKNSVEGKVTPDVPASILQTHGDTTLFLDQAAASLLKS